MGLSNPDPAAQLHKALLTLNRFNLNNQFLTPALKHFTKKSPGLRSLVLWRDPSSNLWQGPHELITWGIGYACVSSKEEPLWLPARHVKPYRGPARIKPDSTDEPTEAGRPSTPESLIAEDTTCHQNNLGKPEENSAQS